MITRKPFKPKRCKMCGEKFTPTRPIQPVCEKYVCKSAYIQQSFKRKRDNQLKKSLRTQPETEKTHKDYLNELQDTFNEWVRDRDRDKTCISCEKKLEGNFDCGHLYSVGGHPGVRFHEHNANGQCRPCNGNFHGSLKDEYERKLIQRIGQEAFDKLKAIRFQSLKLSIPEIIQLIKVYKKKIIEIKKQRKDDTTTSNI